MGPRPGGVFPRAPLALGLALVLLGAARSPTARPRSRSAAAPIQRSENVKARALRERIVAEATRAGDWRSEGTAHLYLADTPAGALLWTIYVWVSKPGQGMWFM